MQTQYSPLDTDNKDQFGLIRDVEVSFMTSNTSKTDLFTLRITVFLDVGFGALEDDSALLLVGLYLIFLQSALLSKVYCQLTSIHKS